MPEQSTDTPTLIDEIDAYCTADGIKPVTFGTLVFSNPRFYERYKARLERDAEFARIAREYMAKYPPREPVAERPRRRASASV